MPIEVGIWRIGSNIERVHFSSIETEAKLEDVLHRDISVLDPSLMVIGRQVSTIYGKYIDLLAIDADGDLTVVELKRDKTPREVVAQTLDYASWVQTLTYDQIAALYAENHSGQHFEEAFSAKFGSSPPETLNEEHHLLVVATELDNSTERIITYLSTYGVPINAVFFRYFKEGVNEYITRTWLIDPNQVEAQLAKPSSTKRAKESWNGQDFYVSLGEGVHRTWDDCRKYGFISAGQGRWYSRTLQILTPGARIFAHVPEQGYVGVGVVQEQAMPVHEFMVQADGKEVPILEAPVKASKMDENADDPELREYLVRVEWLRTVPLSEAIWERGLFANQNSACKLRNKFTLERLTQRFELDEVAA